MAYIYFKCSCGKSLAVDEQGAGLVIECIDCGEPVQIPERKYFFACTECEVTFAAAAGIVGDEVKCLECGNKIIVPEEASPLPEESKRDDIPSEGESNAVLSRQPAAPANNAAPVQNHAGRGDGQVSPGFNFAHRAFRVLRSALNACLLLFVALSVVI